MRSPLGSFEESAIAFLGLMGKCDRICDVGEVRSLFGFEDCDREALTSEFTFIFSQDFRIIRLNRNINNPLVTITKKALRKT
jgi:hypothetical protein